MPSSLDITLSPRSPFCLAWHRTGDNLYVSREEVPGAAVKGCLAETLRKQTGKSIAELADEGSAFAAHFDGILVRHCIPSKPEGERPSAIPLSLIQVRKDRDISFHDVAHLASPHLIEGQAPSFPIDWKGGLPEQGQLQDWFGRPELERELKVHVAMDRRRRKGDDGRLFAHECVVPRPGACVWRGRIDLSSVPDADRRAVLEELKRLLASGLHGLGKTKTFCDVGWSTPEPPPPEQLDAMESDGTRRWILTLQTPALLADPGAVEASGLHSALAATWDKLSKGALRLSHFFAQHELAGGYYLHHRFQKGRDYEPWHLTSAGSVFVLEPADGEADAPDAATTLARWCRTGLPLPSWLEKRGRDWRTCPFLPENGYGEIAVNHPVHQQFAASSATSVEELGTH